jgi:hypothetical protein
MASPKEKKALLASMTAEQKAFNITALTYIKTLASSSNVNIYDWDLLEVFAQEPGGVNLVTDKKIINKRFFDQLDKIKKAPKEAKKVETPEEIEAATLEVEKIKKAFIDAAKLVRQTEIQNLKNNLWTLEDQIRRTQQAYDLSLRQFNESYTKINALEQVADIDTKYLKALEGIQKVIDEGIWINPVYENGYLYLNTKTNIMLHDVNKAANLDLHIDFGQLAVRININNHMRFEVIPYKNNISVESHYHPHVQPAGGICWGEASTASAKNIANLELDKALRLLHALLNSYNPGSPYRPMARFKIEGTKLSRIAEGLKHPDKRKKEKKDDAAAAAMAVPPAPAQGVAGGAAPTGPGGFTGTANTVLAGGFFNTGIVDTTREQF